MARKPARRCSASSVLRDIHVRASQSVYTHSLGKNSEICEDRVSLVLSDMVNRSGEKEACWEKMSSVMTNILLWPHLKKSLQKNPGLEGCHFDLETKMLFMSMINSMPIFT